MIVSQVLFFMALEDIYHMKVNDILQVMLLVAVVLTGDVTVKRIIIALTLVIAYLIYDRYKDAKVGGADIKILFSLILYGGFGFVVGVLFISSLIGIIFSLLTKRKKIPYVPFIWIGYLIVNF